MPSRHLLAPLLVGLTVGLTLATGPSCGHPTSTCASTCTGCCKSDGSCLKSPDNAQVASCGTAGAACANCGSGTCVAFACSGAGGGSAGNCSTTCAGCCSGTSANSICISPPSATNCGALGQVCTSCQAGQACVNGGCVTLDGGAGQVGTPCGTNNECAALGTGHLCKKKTSSGNDVYSGGYCTRDCVLDSDCPSAALCLGAQPGYGEADSVCWARCTTAAECRSGYDCYAVGGGDSACWIAPLPAFDAGPPADKVGRPCASDPECRNPPDDGQCLFDSLSDGGPSPFLGGYCSATCNDSSHCSPDGGAKCIAFLGFGVCVAGCNAPQQGQADCRAGYVCRPVREVDGGILPDGFCWPRCNNPGNGCGPLTCQPTGYCG